MNFLKKRAASTVALVATAAVALTGCSRGEGEPCLLYTSDAADE